MNASVCHGNVTTQKDVLYMHLRNSELPVWSLPSLRQRDELFNS
jgi:hypothetical protein